jgi:hypothetical protein
MGRSRHLSALLFSQVSPDVLPEVVRLHQLQVYGRWLFVILLWLSVGSISLWSFRDSLSLLSEYFTWSGLRINMEFNPWGSLGVLFCVGLTASTLIWQARNILFGLPAADQRSLERQVYRIRQKGNRHPLWKWVTHPRHNREL